MKKQITERLVHLYQSPYFLALCFVAASCLFYFFHWEVFHNKHDLFFYTGLDIAFLPVQVLLVTMVIQKLLERREKQALLKKLNMVIGAFQSEVGGVLLAVFSQADPHMLTIRNELMVNGRWSDKEFHRMAERFKGYNFEIDISKVNLDELRTFLLEKRDFLLRLLENPNLLEHETFTELLQAVFHLVEELSFRQDATGLPDSDRAHLAGDMKRVYGLLARDWLAYIEHLKRDYPYLFSLAIRMNPFIPGASAIVA